MRFRLASSARFARIDHEGVLLLQQAGEVLVINELGMRIIELMDGMVALDTIVDRLLPALEIDRPTLERDVGQFVAELDEAGALEHR